MGTAVIGAPEFRARSGRKVQIRDNGTVTFDHANGYLSPETAMDADEFFQAQKDIEIGRWRWPADPDYLVYPDALREHGARSGIRVWNERTGVSRHYADVGGVDGLGGYFDEAARAYFEAHPVRRSWWDAKPGEVWLITVDGVEVAAVADRNDFNWSAPDGKFAVTRRQDPLITDGRRIWPEDAS